MVTKQTFISKQDLRSKISHSSSNSIILVFLSIQIAIYVNIGVLDSAVHLFICRSVYNLLSLSLSFSLNALVFATLRLVRGEWGISHF